MIRYFLQKLKNTSGSFDTIMPSLIIFLMLVLLLTDLFLVEPFFSDKRITREYVKLADDMICCQPSKAVAVDKFLKSKMSIIHGQGNFDISYYVKSQNDNWALSKDITSQLDTYSFERGDLLVVFFSKENLTPYERFVRRTLGNDIPVEGMIEADRF